jgi:aminoglycoside phosphotransferase (APT) family kinase protein
MQRISTAFVDNLVEIHGIDYAAAGLEEMGQPEGYVRRQIEGWTKRYFNARTDDVPSIERLAKWLDEHAPADSRHGALIHNDYKYDNVVLAPDDLSKITAVLDWEMATTGDPLMDLGTTIAYWVDADDTDEWQQYGFGLTSMPGSLRRAEVVDRYASKSGRDLSNVIFYYAYGLLKIAGIVQQIYARYRAGITKDPRFAGLGELVKACGDLGVRSIEKRRIDRLE